MLKNTLSGLNAVNIIRFNLAADAYQICEILRKYELDEYMYIDTDAFSSKIACFPYSSPPFRYQRNLYTAEK